MHKNKNFLYFLLIFLGIFFFLPPDTLATIGASCTNSDGAVGVCRTSPCQTGDLEISVTVCGTNESCCQSATQGGTNTSPSSGGLQYKLLESIPGFTSGDGSNLPGYIKAIYNLALAIITLSAVLMLTIGGFMYLTSAGNTSAMGTAKSVIFDSLIGLVIALTAWLLLSVINPDLVTVTLNGLSATNIAGTGATKAVTPPVAPGTGAAGTCGGLTPQSGINCGDASQGLSDLLTCIKNAGITASVGSVGDSAGFDTCKNNWSKPPCAHVETSCHYGGGKTKTATECQKSHAADLSVRNATGGYDQSIANAIMSAARGCGARVNDETQIKDVPPHIHVSDQTSCCSL